LQLLILKDSKWQIRIKSLRLHLFGRGSGGNVIHYFQSLAANVWKGENLTPAGAGLEFASKATADESLGAETYGRAPNGNLIVYYQDACR
jgi:hypothetical protein